MQDLWENQTRTGIKISIGQFITQQFLGGYYNSKNGVKILGTG